MNPTPIPFTPPQGLPFGNGPMHLPTSPAGMPPAALSNNEIALQHFRKVKADLRDRDLKQVIVETTTESGPVQLVLSMKTTQIKLRDATKIVLFSCNMDTAECTIDGHPATIEQIQKFQKISDEVQKLTVNGQSKIQNVPRDF
jgi:hypothetical protein